MSRARAGWSPAALLGVVRGGYGLLQLTAPSLIADRVLRRPLDARGKATARVLGVRQIGQAVVSGRDPGYPVLALGVEVDLLHALSMIGLAAVDPRRRPTATVDAVIAASFAAAGALTARAAADGQPPHAAHGAFARWRAEWAARLAAVFVPGYSADEHGSHHSRRLLTGSSQGTILPSGPDEEK